MKPNGIGVRKIFNLAKTTGLNSVKTLILRVAHTITCRVIQNFSQVLNNSTSTFGVFHVLAFRGRSIRNSDSVSFGSDICDANNHEREERVVWNVFIARAVLCVDRWNLEGEVGELNNKLFDVSAGESRVVLRDHHFDIYHTTVSSKLQQIFRTDRLKNLP